LGFKGPLTNFMTALRGFGTSLSGLNEEIELQTIGPGLDEQPAGQVFNPYDEVPPCYNKLISLKNLIKPGISALTTYRSTIQQFWKPGFALFVVPLTGIEIIANSNYGAVAPTSTAVVPSSTTSTTSSSTATAKPTPPPYLLATVRGTPMVVFQLFIKILPDQGTGYQIAKPGIPWQEYTTNLTANQAAGINLIPFIDTVELLVPLDDSGFGVVQDPSPVEPRAPAPTYTTLPNSPDWLRLISQKPGYDVNNDYFYDTTQGAGAKIYIIDTGFFSNATNSVSSLKRSIRSNHTLTIS
jgi:hypothetical protein